MRNRTVAKTEKFASEVCSKVEKEEERDDLGLLEGKGEAVEKEIRDCRKVMRMGTVTVIVRKLLGIESNFICVVF